MLKSDNIAKLATALSKAQAEMPHVKFDAKNPFLKNKYASLGAVIDASVPVMAKHGLSIAQFPVSNITQVGRDQIGVRSVLIHESGEFVEDVIFVTPEVSKGLSINQAAGVSITYLRRYAWASILGLVAEEDLDGDDNPSSKDNASANDAVSQVFQHREWTNPQTEAIAVLSLDAGSPLTHEEAADILDFSVLPGDTSVKTIQSWFKHYMKSEGNVMEKAQSANEAYQKAKKSGGK